jgi:hypothetical protein
MSSFSFDRLTNIYFEKINKLIQEFDKGVITGDEAFMEFRMALNKYASESKRLYNEISNIYNESFSNFSVEFGAAMSDEMIKMSIMIAERFGELVTEQ